jgi:hypothetical protein
VRQGFFETVANCLSQKVTLRQVQQMLQPHSLEEADRMGSIKPELLAKLKSALKEQNPITVSKQTTDRFNSTQTRIKSQSLA